MCTLGSSDQHAQVVGAVAVTSTQHDPIGTQNDMLERPPLKKIDMTRIGHQHACSIALRVVTMWPQPPC